MNYLGTVLTLCVCLYPAMAAITVDTIGTTGIDAQNYGPIWQRVIHLPGTGIYTAWLKTGMFANFFSFATNTWSGEISVFGSQRNASGSLTVPENPTSPYYRSTFISSFINRDPKWPIIAVDSVPGENNFIVRELDSSLMGCQRPPITITQNNYLHIICVDSTTQETLLYSRSTDYGVNWQKPVPLSGNRLLQDPTYNIAGSKSSNRLAVVWTQPDSAAIYINISEDGGDNWTGPQNIFPVPTTIPGARPGRFGAYPLFDRQNRLNIVTQIWDGNHQFPAEIWHWQENRNPAWCLVYRFSPASVLAPAEPGEPFVVRPTLGENQADGTLFVLWLNYDSLNYEPQTQIARADLFVAYSPDNGNTWSRPYRLTGPDGVSRLSPGLASVVNDTLFIITVIDQIAGVYEHGHGPQTVNPVVLLRIPISDLPGIAEGYKKEKKRPFSVATLRNRYNILGDKMILSPLGQNQKCPPGAGVYFIITRCGNIQKVVIIP